MQFSQRPARRISFLASGLLVLLTAATMASLLYGPVPIGIERTLASLAGHGDDIAEAIVVDLRLPRTILGLGVGAMLGAAGAALQGYLRNPLAEPSVLGASNAAALGAVIALYFGLAEWHPAALPLMAIVTGLGSLILLFALTGRSESPLSLILGGIAVSTLAGAAISLALNLSPNPFAAMEIMTWLLGSLENRSVTHLWIALPCVGIGLVLLFVDGRALDALTLGDDSARALGNDLKRTRMRLMLGIAIGVGGAVAVSGAIGFVGLIVPHLIRPFTDRRPSSLILPSALGGAALLTLADVGVRIIPSTNELKLGVVTAFLGVPVFFAQLIRERRVW